MSKTPHTITGEILKILSGSRMGMSANRILSQMSRTDDPETFKVSLCMTVKRGYVYRDGKTVCDSCCVSHICYRITEKGRIRLRELL